MRRLPTPGLVPLVLVVAACGGGLGAVGVSSAPASAPGSVATSPSADASPGGSVASACAVSTETATVEIAIAEFGFDPAEATASVGDVVAWTNNDTAGHNATFGDAGCATETLGNGDSGALVFNEPGTYSYICSIHPVMEGTLEVSG